MASSLSTFMTLERRWFVQFCVGILIATANGACFTFGIFSPYIKMDGFRYTQSELNLVSTVGVVLSYFSLPTGFLYDRYGPRAVLLVGSSLNVVGWLGMYVIFYDMQHPVLSRNVLVMSLFYGISQFSASYYEQGCILTNLKAFSCYRGPVVVIQKTFMGLGSALVAQVYALFFAHNAHSIAGFFIFLAAFSVVVGVLSVCFADLPTPRTRCLGLNVLEATTQARRTGQSALFNTPFRLGTGLLIASVVVILTSALLEGVTNLPRLTRFIFWLLTIALYLSFAFMIVVAPSYAVNVGGYRGAVVQDEHGVVYGAERRDGDDDEEATSIECTMKSKSAQNIRVPADQGKESTVDDDHTVNNESDNLKDDRVTRTHLDNNLPTHTNAKMSQARCVGVPHDSTTMAEEGVTQARGVSRDYRATAQSAPFATSPSSSLVLQQTCSDGKVEGHTIRTAIQGNQFHYPHNIAEAEDACAKEEDNVCLSSSARCTAKYTSSSQASPHVHNLTPNDVVVTSLDCHARTPTKGSSDRNRNNNVNDEDTLKTDGKAASCKANHARRGVVTAATAKDDEDDQECMRVVPSSILTSSFEERTYILNGHTLWENVHHRDLWMLWFICFAVWSTMTLVFTNSSQIYQSLAVNDFSLITNSVFVSLLGIGSALGRIAVGLMLPILHQRYIPLTLILFLAPLINVVGLLLFLVVPLWLLFLPFSAIGLAIGVSWGVTVLVITQFFEPNNCGKHYSILYTAGMISPLIFNTSLFGPIYDYYSAQQSLADERTCYGVVCIYIPLIVCAFVNFVAVLIGYMFMQRTESRRGIVITPSIRPLA